MFILQQNSAFVKYFIALKEGVNKIQAPISTSIFLEILMLAARELVYSLDNDNKIAVFKKLYEIECFNKAIDLAYNIIKLEKDIPENQQEITSIKNEIRNTLKNVPYILNAKHISDGIQEILTSALNV